MILKKNFNPLKVISYVWRELLAATLVSGLVFWLYTQEVKTVALPFTPIGILGTALAIFLAFRNNASYARWWEARTIWANLLNSSRIFARQIIANADSALAFDKGGGTDKVQAYKKEMIHRQIAFAHALRLELRRQTVWEEIKPFISETEYRELLGAQNKANLLLQKQGARIKEGMRAEILGPFDNITLEPNLAACNNWQTACERIKETPMLRQYEYFTRLFVWIFIVLLPFSLMDALKAMPALVMPFAIVIAFVFATIERVGAVNENPFENKIQDVPLTAICRTIERDLKEQLGETDLPPKLEPENGYLY
jgi:putative membrane protein